MPTKQVALCDDMKIVEIELIHCETVIAVAGAMNYMEEGVSFEAKMGEGSKPVGGLINSLLHVSKIIPLEMAQLGEELICL